jgi:adenosine deaminase
MLKYLLIDDDSLTEYKNADFPAFADIKRRLLLKAREHNRFIPDHFYRLEQQETFKDIESINKIFSKGIPELASDFLELHNTKVYVKQIQQNNWQELITYIPPLFLQCAFLHKIKPMSIDNREIIRYYSTYILPNTKYTCIPSPKIPQLDFFLKKNNGLHDLHMHLNGTIETDHVWQDYLFTPNGVFKDLDKAFKDEKVKEQLEQESHLLNPLDYVHLLQCAQKLRSFFYNYLFPVDTIKKNQFSLLQAFLDPTSNSGSYRHPFLDVLNAQKDYPYLMSAEGLMYMLMLREFSLTKNETLAGFFHFYLLILGLTNRLLVQQTHQAGFQQFQKHTLNGLREESEKLYTKRYLQMQGNDSTHLRFLEGRFSPKSKQKDLIKFIDTIWKGWEKMHGEIPTISENASENKPQLRLIAHFIKKEDKHPDEFIRHKQLRKEIWERARVLSALLINHTKYREKVVGVDAAASEFDAPPEVFAPIFRMLRRGGIKHFTYHAGEDFYHIVSGLRAVYEAVTFCDLQQGDRIGHATATALCPKLWHKEIGNPIRIRQGEYLDNLVFTYHLIINSKIEKLHVLVPFIINRVQNLNYEIYKKHHSIAVLEKAWLMRKCCPLHTLYQKKDDVDVIPVFDEEWNLPIIEDFLESRQYLHDNAIWSAYSDYHEEKYKKNYDKIIIVDPFEILKNDDIVDLQLALLEIMNNKEIVIETLPTSNVRIGLHRNFSSYHLWNWIKWKKDGKSIPPIIVGSDDTGIFATNIYNEYANIYCMLLNTHKMPHWDIMEVIKKLDEDSRIYRFE